MSDETESRITDGALWLSANKGFVSMVLGFIFVGGGIFYMGVSLSNWTLTMQHRMEKVEDRQHLAEQTLKELTAITRTISDEQLRRTSPVAEIKAISEQIKRIEEKIDRKAVAP